MASISFVEKLKITGRVATMGGLLYIMGLWVIHLVGGDYSSTPDWWYRILIIIFITWGVWAFRLKVRGYTNFFKSMGAAWMTIIIMTLIMVGDTFVFREYIAPEYNKEAFNVYKTGQYNQTVVAYLNTEEKNELTPEETKTLTEANDIRMEKQRYFFTTNGAILVLLITNTVWGLMISVTVSMLAQPAKKKED